MRAIEKKPVVNLNYQPDRIMKILGDPQVVELLNKINEEYYYWEKVNFIPD